VHGEVGKSATSVGGWEFLRFTSPYGPLRGNSEHITNSGRYRPIKSTCGISPRCGSYRHLCSASAAVSPHPCGSLGLCEKLPQSGYSLRHNPRAWLLRGHERLATKLMAPAWPRRQRTRHPQRSHSVSPSTAASRRGAAAIGTFVRPQRPCPRTPAAPSVSAKITPNRSLTPAQPPS